MARQLGGLLFSTLATVLLWIALWHQPDWLTTPILFVGAATADVWVRRIGGRGPGPWYMEAYLWEWGQALLLAIVTVLASTGVGLLWGPPIVPVWPVLGWRLLSAFYPSDREGRLPA